MNEELWGFFVVSFHKPSFDGSARIASLFSCKHLHHSGKRSNRDSNLPTSLKFNHFIFIQGLMI